MNELQIEYVDIKSIKPYKKNARKHSKESVDVIAESIQEFGMADPIAVWKNTIVEGHGRWLACKKLGYDKVPVTRLEQDSWLYILTKGRKNWERVET